MSYYSPNWANLEAGWFSDQRFDALWTPECDRLLEEYAERYAPFLLAFVGRFQKEVLARFKIRLASTNIDYAVLSKAAQNAHVAHLWQLRHEALLEERRDCCFCDRQFRPLDTHPNVIRNCGTDVRWCRGCNYTFWRYAAAWSDDLAARVADAKKTAGVKRTCRFCGGAFNLLKHFYSSRSFNDDGILVVTLVGHEDCSGGHAGVDFLYPNLYVGLCPECFGKCFSPAKTAGHTEILEALKQLGQMIGKIPTQDFDSYVYLFNTPDGIADYVSLMHHLPSPEQIKAHFGSFFAAVARSGLLPDGARRMKIGTMVMSQDGDLCFSLPERDIDNWMFSQGIAHQKEVRYPQSDMRCDWEVFGLGERVFVEYFGLLNQTLYAEKARQKTDIARLHSIRLIELSPDVDWKPILQSALLAPLAQTT